MPSVTTKTFGQLLQGQAAAVQAKAAGLVDFTVGSAPRAFAEAVSGIALWLQGLILVLLATTRAATSTGPDLDSFVADFGAAPQTGDETLFGRLGAVAASGAQTFTRLTASGTTIVPIGTTVQTTDGSQQYVLVADQANSAYSAPLGGYVMADGIGSVTAPVQCTTAGAAGNAVVGAVNTISGAVPGVDTTTNAVAFTNGVDAESDAAMRTRFRTFIASLRKATPLSLKAAVEALQTGVTCKIIENQLADGTPQVGFVLAVVDDGTGAPSSSLLTAAAAAVDTVHGAGIEFAVQAPTVVSVGVSGVLTTIAGADHAAAVADAAAAVTAYLSTLAIGQNVIWSRVWQVLQDANDDILEVSGLVVHGGATDVTIGQTQVAKPGTIALT